MSAFFDISSLAAVKNEIDQTFRHARELLMACPGQPDPQRALQQALACLHQAAGALQVIGLEGAARVAGELEIFTGLMARQALESSPANLHRVAESVTLLARYLDQLMAGAPDRPLVLFPQYEALQRARGLANVSPADLFFPDTSLQVAPPVPSAQPITEEALCGYLKTCRHTYEHGLSQWIEPAHAAGLAEMLQAVGQVEAIQTDAASLAFWQVAAALLTGLQQGLIPANEHLQQLAVRLGLQIRKLSLPVPDGNGKELLLRSMLFYLASCRQPEPRIDAIRRLFRLDEHLPCHTPSHLASQTDLNLHSQLRALLETAKHLWTCVNSGEPQQLSAFSHCIRQLRNDLPALEQPALARLAAQAHDVSLSLNGQAIGEPLALEMAAVILLIEFAVEHVTLLSGDFSDLAEQQGERLQQAAAGHPLPAVTGQWISLLNLAGQHAQERLLVRQITEVIRDNLATAASAIENWSQDTGTEEVHRAMSLLKQVAGAFDILAYESAALLARRCLAGLEHARQCTDPSSLDAVAEGVVALDLFIIGLQHAQASQDHWLEVGLARLPAHPPPLLAPSPRSPQQTLHAADAQTAGFVQEARSLIDQAGQQIVLMDLGDYPQQAIDRFGHLWQQIKQLSKSASLDLLVAAAEAMEQLCQPPLLDAPIDLGEFLSVCHEAHATFTHWLSQLEQQEPPDALRWPGEAIRLVREKLATQALPNACKGGIPADPSPHPPRQEPSPEAASPDSGRMAGQLTPKDVEHASSDPELTIGPVRIPASLFELFTQEAQACLASLQSGYQAVIEQQAVVSYDFMRAAHTLVGIARTVGCQPIAELSRALEIRLHQLLDTGQWPSVTDRELLDHAVAALEGMLNEFLGRHYPAHAAGLVQALQQAAKGQLGGSDTTSHVRPVSNVPAYQPPDSAAVPTPLPGAAPYAQPAHQEAGIEDAIDRQLLPVFLEEATELYLELCRDLRNWREQPTHPPLAAALQRSLHTLKGSARMTGANRLGAVAHRMESLLLTVDDSLPAGELIQTLEADLDQIGIYITLLQTTPAKEATSAGLAAGGQATGSQMPQPALADQQGVAPSRTFLRVAARVVDDLVNDAGEISIARAGVHENLHEISAACTGLAASIARLQEQVRQIEIQGESLIQSRLPEGGGADHPFDPLEFDRFTGLHAAMRAMTQNVSEMGVLQASLLHPLDNAENALRQQARVIRQLQQVLMRIRLVPFASVTERFYQIARQVSRQLKKQVALSIEGEQVEIDRSVLEVMTAPIEHLLRNAIDHGIEAPEARRATGKPDRGQIMISARPGRNEIILQVKDDGSGMDLERLWRKAAEQGLLASGTPSGSSLINLIFLPGFSTADSVTEISGRGVGMNIVHNEITALGGRIDVDTQPGQGTAFTIYLPLTLATMQVLLVRCKEEIYAFPAVMVEQVLMQKNDELTALYGAQEIGWNDLHYPFYSLHQLVGHRSPTTAWPSHNSVILLESGHGRVGVHVDEIIGNQEVVVKNIGPQLARVPGIAGATILANGREVVILNPVILAHEIQAHADRLAGPLPAAQPSASMLPAAISTSPTSAAVSLASLNEGPQCPPVNLPPPVDSLPASNRPLVMIVDDSLTVRKVTARVLRRAGFEVASAKDGLDALAQMQARPPALMLVDIEMPGMNGFDLTRNIRSTPLTADVPIIMMTSRTAEKHRHYAMRLGVNAYLGKPYQEDELLREIHRLLERSA